jgi:hypothetical protein
MLFVLQKTALNLKQFVLIASRCKQSGILSSIQEHLITITFMDDQNANVKMGSAI